MNSLLLTDGYKLGHNKQYPEDTTLVFSNFTPRSGIGIRQCSVLNGNKKVFEFKSMQEMVAWATS